MGMSRKNWFGIVRHKILRSSHRKRETIIVLHTNNTLARSSFADEATTVQGEEEGEEEVKDILEVVGECTDVDAQSSVATELIRRDDDEDDDDDDDDDYMLVMCVEHIAATKIQAHFRSHLARRAYRALRSLVKLQAVVRGVLVRSQARLALECMHALARLQVTVRARQLLTNYQSPARPQIH